MCCASHGDPPSTHGPARRDCLLSQQREGRPRAGPGQGSVALSSTCCLDQGLGPKEWGQRPPTKSLHRWGRSGRPGYWTQLTEGPLVPQVSLGGYDVHFSQTRHTKEHYCPHSPLSLCEAPSINPRMACVCSEREARSQSPDSMRSQAPTEVPGALGRYHHLSVSSPLSRGDTGPGRARRKSWPARRTAGPQGSAGHTSVDKATGLSTWHPV